MLNSEEKTESLNISSKALKYFSKNVPTIQIFTIFEKELNTLLPTN